MKNVSMQVYKLVTLLVLLLFVNCQKEDFSSNQNQEIVTKPLYKQRTVSLSEIPKIEQKVIEKLNPEIFNRTEGSTNNQAIFDTENVLEIIDTLNNANYSLQFRFPDTPISTFYNLVVGETPNGEVLTPYIMKYKCDDASLDNYIANGLDFNYFEGTMSIHKYTDFFALGEFDRTETECPPELDEAGDPIPCIVTNVSGSGSLGGFGTGSGLGNTGSGTGNTGGTGGTGGGSFGCVYQGVYVVGCGGDNNEILHPYGECWNPTGTGVQQYNLWECHGEPVNPTSPNQGEGEGRTVNDDCPGCDTNDGGVPINTIGNLIDKDALTVINNCSYFDQELILNIVDNQLETAIANYITENGCSTETEVFLEEAIIEFEEILEEIPDAKFERYIELLELIEEDPWVLIQDCAEQNGMDTQNYLDLYNLPFPQQCSDRLFNLGVEWHHQPITDGNVPLANIDYYGVEVTNYPDFNNDGNPDNEAEIYQAFREKFIDVASGDLEDFQFSCDSNFDFVVDSDDKGDIEWDFIPLTVQDGIDFISNDPISSILLIEADATGFFPTIAADDGAVMVSDFTNNDWTISTIMTANNGTQPFSGNRQWGWLINQNGNFEFFTRAVDVANISILLNIGASTECQQDTYYNIAEATWENMQQEITDWVNNNGGTATIVPKTAVRVDRDKIIELLTNNESIDQIMSNCN